MENNDFIVRSSHGEWIANKNTGETNKQQLYPANKEENMYIKI